MSAFDPLRTFVGQHYRSHSWREARDLELLAACCTGLPVSPERKRRLGFD